MGENLMFTELQIGKQKDFFNRRVISLAFILFVLSACSVVRGSGNVVTESRAVSDFNQVSLSGSGELILNQGERESLEIEAEDNIIAVIETEVRDNTLYIGVKENTAISPTEPVRFYLTMNEVAGLELSGSGSITADSLATDRLALDVNGSGDISIDSLSASSLAIGISGSGRAEVAGQATSQVITIDGSGEVQTADLESEAADVEVNGSGEATVWASQTLSAEINGSGKVSYYGSPTGNQTISGSGEVNSLGTR